MVDTTPRILDWLYDHHKSLAAGTLAVLLAGASVYTGAGTECDVVVAKDMKLNLAQVQEFDMETETKSAQNILQMLGIDKEFGISLGQNFGNEIVVAENSNALLKSNGIKAAYTTTSANFDSAVNPLDVHAIAINGTRKVYMATRDDAQAVIDGIIERYTGERTDIISAEFVQNVDIEFADDYVTAEMAEKDKTISETYLCQPYEAIEYLLNGTNAPKTYVVQSGDTVWDIAIRNGLSPYELEQMNPNINVDRLKIGDTINLYEKKSFITLNTIEVATEVERISYDVEYTQTEDLYKGQTQVTSAGSYGSKEKKVEYTRQNGVIVGTKVLEETIISEPVTQYALIGTTTMPIKTGSGSLQAPLASTQVSSAAGNYGANRGSRSHAGVDLKGAKGDPVYASDGGTVIFSGYSGTYGYIVKVDHGNGIETRYAHCDQLLVAYGDNVEKGQQIATVGKTGNATGYLLHFEVLINGKTVNPINYI